MIKHLKKFNTSTEYQTFKNGNEYRPPQVSYIPPPEMKVYYNKRTAAPSNWVNSNVWNGNNLWG